MKWIRVLVFFHNDGKEEVLLDFARRQHVNVGVAELNVDNLPGSIELKYNSIQDAAKGMGGAKEIREMFIDFQKHLFKREASLERS